VQGILEVNNLLNTPIKQLIKIYIQILHTMVGIFHHQFFFFCIIKNEFVSMI
jgi:hypothetical protein